MTVTSLTTVASQTPVVLTVGVGFGTVAADGFVRANPLHSVATALPNQELLATGIFAAGTFFVQVSTPAP